MFQHSFQPIKNSEKIFEYVFYKKIPLMSPWQPIKLSDFEN